MEFSIIEAIFTTLVPVEVLADMLTIGRQYPTCFTFTGERWKVTCAELCMNSARMTVHERDGKKYRVAYKNYTKGCKLSMERILDDGSVVEFRTIPVEFAEFLYYKLAFVLRGQDLLVWDDNHNPGKSVEKLPENLVPDRLMLTILDSIFDNRNNIEIRDISTLGLNSVKLGRFIDPDIQFGFVESYKAKKKLNAYFYEPKRLYYQSLWNSGMKSSRENCTHLKVAIEIAYRWWKFSKSLVEIPEK